MGVSAGLAGIVFQSVGQVVIQYTLVHFAGYAPAEAIGEHALFDHSHVEHFSPWMIVIVMALGGVVFRVDLSDICT